MQQCIDPCQFRCEKRTRCIVNTILQIHHLLPQRRQLRQGLIQGMLPKEVLKVQEQQQQHMDQEEAQVLEEVQMQMILFVHAVRGSLSF
jgi:hypothetical protein